MSSCVSGLSQRDTVIARRKISGRVNRRRTQRRRGNPRRSVLRENLKRGSDEGRAYKGEAVLAAAQFERGAVAAGERRCAGEHSIVVRAAVTGDAGDAVVSVS